MSKLITIAVDAMGGDNSPNKVIDGIIHHNKLIKIVFIRSLAMKQKLKSV